jgi:hypothetical protein
MAATPAINIVIPQGADFGEVFTSTESDGTLSNLVGFTGRSKLRKYSGSPTVYDFVVGINTITSEVSIAMTSPVTTKLAPGRYQYDVALVSSIGGVTRMVEGQAMVTAGIST